MQDRDDSSAPLASPRSFGGEDLQSGWSTDTGQEPTAAQESPLLVIQRIMYGRWRYALILAVILAPICGVAGFILAPIKYKSASVLAVESTLPALVEETIETAGIPELASFVGQQSQYIRDPLVFRTAFDSPSLTDFAVNRDGFRESIVSQIRVINPRSTSLLIVEMEDANPEFAAASVNAVVDAYMAIYAPDAKADYALRLESIKSMAASAERDVENLKVSRNNLLRDARYGISDSPTIIAENVAEIRRLELDIMAVQASLDLVREQYIADALVEAKAKGEELDVEAIEVPASATLVPTVEQLAEVEPTLPQLQENLRQAEVSFAALSDRFGKGHQNYKRQKGLLENTRSSFEARLESARTRWSEAVGSRYVWGALEDRRKNLQANVKSLVDTNAGLYLELIEAEEFGIKIRQKQAEYEKLELRRMEIERESEL